MAKSINILSFRKIKKITAVASQTMKLFLVIADLQETY